MELTDFHELLDKYQRLRGVAIDTFERLATLEDHLEEAVVTEATKLVGTHNAHTGRDHSWTSAVQAVKDDATYHQQKREMIKLRATAEHSLVLARTAEYRLQYLIKVGEEYTAKREGEVVA